MRICLLSDEHYPYRGPDTEVVVNTAAALGGAGAEVELVVPHCGAGQAACEQICAYYGVQPTFRLVPLPTPLPVSRRFRMEKFSHAWAGPRHALRAQPDVVLTRDILAVARLHQLRLPWCFETYRRHAAERAWLPRLLRRVELQRGIGAVAHNDLCRHDLIQLGFAPDAVLTARVGIANACLNAPPSQAEARRRCGLPTDARIVAFVGNVRHANGIQDVFQLAAELPEMLIVVVGGAEHDVHRLSSDVAARGLRNVRLVGHRPASEAPLFLFAADALFAPAVFTNAYFRREWLNRLCPRVLPGTPMKLFNYLAAGRPIVAADQPEMREAVQHEFNALLIPPCDAVAAAAAVRRLIAEPNLAQRLVRQGQDSIARYTWAERGRRLVDFFASRLATRPLSREQAA